MNATLDEWKALLVSLSVHERAELAHYLLESLEPEDESVEAAWDAEASRRVREIREIRDGAAEGRDADSFLGELRERYP